MNAEMSTIDRAVLRARRKWRAGEWSERRATAHVWRAMDRRHREEWPQCSWDEANRLVREYRVADDPFPEDFGEIVREARRGLRAGRLSWSEAFSRVWGAMNPLYREQNHCTAQRWAEELLEEENPYDLDEAAETS